MALDGKIYIAYGDFNNPNGQRLDVINNPNVAGLGCNYMANAVPSINGSVQLGLPNFIDGYFQVTTPKIDLGPDISNLCAGNPVTLDPGNVCASTYVWSTGATTQTLALAPTATGTYTVSVTNFEGCTATDAISIQVSTPPLAQASVSAPALCTGTSVTLSATPQAGCSYTWSPAAGLSATTGATVTATPAANTTYTVTVTDGNNCTATDNVSVSLLSLPTANVSGPSQPVCPGTAVSINASGSYTCVWSPASGLNTTSGATVTATPSANTTYTVTVTDGNNCSATGAVTVSLAPTPTVSAGPDRLVCNGLPVTIGQNTPSPGDHYQWSSSDTTANPSVTPTANTSYTVTITTSPYACTATSSVSLTTGLADVHVPPIVKLCKGADTVLNPGGNPSYIYQWGPPAGLSATNIASPIAMPNTTTSYTVTITDPGITNGPCPVIATEVVDVSGTPLAVTITNSDTQSMCPGAAAVLSAYSNNSHTSFAWFANRNFNNQLNASITDSVYTAMPNVTTTFYLKPYNNYCSHVIDSTVVLVDDMSVFPDTTYICPGTQALIGIKNPHNLPLTYQWYSSAGGISGPDDQDKITVAPASDAVYYVSVKNPHGCSTVLYSAVQVGSVTTVLTTNKTDITKGEEVVLSAQPASASYTYIWSPVTGTTPPTGAVISVFPAVTTTYHVRIADNGHVSECLGEDSVVVNVHEKNVCDPESIYIPNAFSPNGDGRNDVLYVRSKTISNIQCQIYNRWGDKVAEINNISSGWDGSYNGQILEDGVYVYFLRYVCLIDGQPYLKKGNVSILK